MRAVAIASRPLDAVTASSLNIYEGRLLPVPESATEGSFPRRGRCSAKPVGAADPSGRPSGSRMDRKLAIHAAEPNMGLMRIPTTRPHRR